MSGSSSTTSTRSPAGTGAVTATLPRDAARHDDVRVALARLDELEMHGMDRGEVLVEDLLQRPAALFHVAADAADEPDVGGGVDEGLHVATRPHALVHEQQDAVDDDDVGGFDALRPVLPQVRDEVVDRFLNRFPP